MLVLCFIRHGFWLRLLQAIFQSGWDVLLDRNFIAVLVFPITIEGIKWPTSVQYLLIGTKVDLESGCHCGVHRERDQRVCSDDRYVLKHSAMKSYEQCEQIGALQKSPEFMFDRFWIGRSAKGESDARMMQCSRKCVSLFCVLCLWITFTKAYTLYLCVSSVNGLRTFGRFWWQERRNRMNESIINRDTSW